MPGMQGAKRPTGEAWLPILIAVAVLPAVFVPVRSITDFFYLPKVLVLMASELVLIATWLRHRAAGFAHGTSGAAQVSAGTGAPAVGNPLVVPLLAYWAVLALATWQSVDPWQSLLGEPFRWEGLLTFLLYGGLVLLLPLAGTSGVARRIDQLLQWGMAVAAGIVAYGLLQRYGLDPMPRDAIRSSAAWWRASAFATLGNSNFFGSFTAMYVGMAASRYLAGGGAWLAGAAVVCYGMLTSLSRGSWLAAAGAMVIVLAAMLVRPPEKRRDLWRRAFTLAVMAALLTVLWRLADPLASDRVSALVQDTANQSGTVGQRFWIWRVTWNAIQGRPWLGYGPDTLGQVFPHFELPGRNAVGLAGAFVDRAHNDYLQVAVSSGLLGLAAYLWLLVRAGRSAWGVIAGPKATSLEQQLAWGLTGGVVAHLLAMGANLSTVSESPPFWGFLGAAAALWMAVRARS